MSGKTGIQWTDRTWNPIRGCTRVSEGCRNCYAERQAHRFSGRGGAYEGLTKLVNGHPAWTGAIKFAENHLLDPLRWREPCNIFVNSMSDLFHKGVTNEMLHKIFAVMALCPQHRFQVLTKRPERMPHYFTDKHRNPQGWPAEDYDVQTCIRLSTGGLLKTKSLPNGCPDMKHFMKSGTAERYRDADLRLFHQWPLTNVWLGVSCEDQATANERIPLLLQTPAAVRFISAEPLVSAIDLSAHAIPALWNGGLHWVIAGGESGPGARFCDIGWIRNIVGQCKQAQVPVFVKQLGARPGVGGKSHTEICLNDSKGGDISEWPEDLRIREFPKEAVTA